MKQVLILKDVALLAKQGGGSIAGIHEVDLLASGALAIFSEQGGIIDGTATAGDLNDVSKVIFAVGKGSNEGAYISQPIERRRAVVEKTVYAAPVKQLIYVGNNTSTGSFNFPTLAAGDELFLKIVDNTGGTMPPKKYENYSYTVKAGDTNVMAADALLAKVTANSDIVTTTNVGASVGWGFTAKNNGQTFQVSVDGVLSGALITQYASPAVRPTYGHGTYAQILKMEQESLTELGNWNKIHLTDYYFSRVPESVLAATYDTYMIQWEQIHQTATSQKTAGVWELMMALPTAPATFTTFDALLTVIFGSPFLAGASGGAETGV